MFEQELKVATYAVRKASLLTKRIQSNVIKQRATSTITKSDSSPVTVADYAAQTLIINAIKTHFPEDRVVGEEDTSGLSEEFLNDILGLIHENDAEYKKVFRDGDADFQFTSDQFPLDSTKDVRRAIDQGDYEGGPKGRFWCLDPIDGTKGFLRGAQFAVCLGLIVDGVVKVGCIGCPNLQLTSFGGTQELSGSKNYGYLFRAIKGSGRAEYSGTENIHDWTPIKVRQLKSTAEMIALEGVEKSHSSHDEQDLIKEELHIQEPLHLDSQVKYCLLALGLADVYLRLPIKLSYEEKIWDHAAGNAILLEAGGIHTDSLDNVVLDFGEGRTLKTKGVIATSGPTELHTKVVETASKIIQSRAQ